MADEIDAREEGVTYAGAVVQWTHQELQQILAMSDPRSQKAENDMLRAGMDDLRARLELSLAVLGLPHQTYTATATTAT